MFCSCLWCYRTITQTLFCTKLHKHVDLLQSEPQHPNRLHLGPSNRSASAGPAGGTLITQTQRPVFRQVLQVSGSSLYWTHYFLASGAVSSCCGCFGGLAGCCGVCFYRLFVSERRAASRSRGSINDERGMQALMSLSQRRVDKTSSF